MPWTSCRWPPTRTRTSRSTHYRPAHRMESTQSSATLTVRDNGIGMTRDEVVDLIGTIAKSGTADVGARCRQARENGSTSQGHPELIGQFGVGFYSSFMVADQVVLVTRKAGEPTAASGGNRPARAPTPSATNRCAARHLGDPAPQTRGHRGRAAGFHEPATIKERRQALLRLHRLAHPDGRRYAAGRRRWRRHGGSPRTRDHQLAGGPLGTCEDDVSRRNTPSSTATSATTGTDPLETIRL